MINWNIIFVVSLIILVFSIGLTIHSTLTQPKFEPQDCEIFENIGEQIDVSDGGQFFPLDLELCEYCGVKC